jgi:hypothetical protein
MSRTDIVKILKVEAVNKGKQHRNMYIMWGLHCGPKIEIQDRDQVVGLYGLS